MLSLVLSSANTKAKWVSPFLKEFSLVGAPQWDRTNINHSLILGLEIKTGLRSNAGFALYLLTV